MRVAINCRSFLKKNYTGIGRYAYNLVRSLEAIDQDNAYQLYVPKRIFDFKRRVPRFAAANFRSRVDYWSRGPARTLGPVDAYHLPSPEMVPDLPAKIVVTVHDLIYKTYPQGHTPETCAALEEQMASIASRADGIICCSRSTVADLKRFFSIDDQRISLVYQGVDQDVFSPLSDEERPAARDLLRAKGIDRPFILFVGTIEPRKNLRNLVRAFARLKARKAFSGSLVIIGMKGWMMEGFEAEIEAAGVREDIVLQGYVPDRDLRIFYDCAEVFVFPSFYEGFGFPLVEAFSCGAAVVTSQVSSCPEIAGDAALTVDPHDPEAMAKAIEEVLSNSALRAELKARALQRARAFSFQNTARQTLAVYRRVCGDT